MTEALQQRLLFCGPEERWALPRDHIPVKIELDLQPGADPLQKCRQFALDKLDLEGLKAVVAASHWAQTQSPLENLQATLEQHLPLLCPKSNPCPRARPEWSPQAASLLSRVKQARQLFTQNHRPEDRQSYKCCTNQLKQELRRNSRALWRDLVSSIATNQRLPHNKGLWRLSKWSRRTAGRPHSDPQLPALRRNDSNQATACDRKRTEILIEKFFPPPPTTPPITAETVPNQRPIQMDSRVTAEEVEGVLKRLPRGKAPGPDGIPNEILTLLAPDIAADIAQALSDIFAAGSIPVRLKESITLALRKEDKKDYSLPGSYRPIALENALAKVIEKVLANQISQAAEESNLLPWNQMGARRNRSTLTAIGLLTTCVQTA